MEKTFRVLSCEIKKQGTNERTGKDWTLYLVRCEGDAQMKEFTTFNSAYQNSVGQQMRGTFEYDSKWKNWKEVSVKKAEENTKHEEIMNALRENWSMLDDIRKLLSKDLVKNGNYTTNNQSQEGRPNTGGAEESAAFDTSVPKV